NVREEREKRRAVSGFGPKQASLYLRRIGYCADLAVLDTHIVDYLRLAKEIEISPYKLSRVESYEKCEHIFVDIAKKFGRPVGQLDLAMWVTMRAAKQGTISWVS
ncbi:MAG: hypothetical protein D3910_18655, partial [Candidatus Electrothrix sp. ATG2]|nr:hypothetical protein [Candidatus Electrothrix sp. ATG2]